MPRSLYKARIGGHAGKALSAPFPYFGGKSLIAHEVWSALGNVKHYIEPFFGSGAVLLARPNYRAGEHVESICDKDGYVCNVWRALQFAPDEVARWCDWPVNHADLIARKAALLKNEARLLANLVADEKWCDPIMAGYWVWSASCWIGSGLTRPKQMKQIPLLSHGGKGVHKLSKRLNRNDNDKGVQEPYNTNIYAWFRQLSERLRYVRTVCGDWTCICGGDWQDSLGMVGMFFDPPYGVGDRHTNIYHHDSTEVAHEVATWCAARGERKSYRIVLAGYEEAQWLVNQHGWRVKHWTAPGGYGKLQRKPNSQAIGLENRKREAVYFSPYCVALDLFDSIACMEKSNATEIE